MSKSIVINIEKVEDGYTAYAKARSIFAEGDTFAEVKENFKEALALQCEHTGEDVKQLALVMVFDVPSLFDAFDFIKTKSFATRIGMNVTLLNHYAKGVKKPGAKQKVRIEQGIQTLVQELASAHVTV